VFEFLATLQYIGRCILEYVIGAWVLWIVVNFIFEWLVGLEEYLPEE
jgi:hypothetical protein